MDAQAYSARELTRGGVPALEQFCSAASNGPEVAWTDPNLARVVRLRLIGHEGDPYYELLYCFGELKDGQPCRVWLPFECLAMPRKGMRAHLARVARNAGLIKQDSQVYLSLFKALSTLE